MNPKTINLLVPNISLPTVGAALRIARMLESRYRVSIVGPDMGHGICPMYRGSFDFVSVSTPRLYRLPDFWWERRKLVDALDGDLIISLKAFASSLPTALLAKKRRKIPVVVYLDEWDGAIVRMWPKHKHLMGWMRDFYHPGADIFCPWVERMIPRADAVVSTTRFLQSRFGGTIIPLGVDPEVFKPQSPGDVETLRRELGLEGLFLIGFGGVVRPHKGLEVFLQALVRIGNPTIKLLIIGPLMPVVRDWINHPEYGRYVLCQGSDPDDQKSDLNAQIHKRMPLYLSLADVLAVPLRDSLLSRSQMPCKVFEALAMAKPILASAVSDLPEVVGDAGWLVPPDDVDTLAETIQEIIRQPEEARCRGQVARERAITRYAMSTCSGQWLALMEQLI